MNYQGQRWKKKRAHILRLDGYKDRVEARYGRTVEANTVHHIFPAQDYPEYAWEDWNLISVSKETHSKLHYRLGDELTDMGKALMQRTTPGVDWRKGNAR